MLRFHTVAPSGVVLFPQET